ncbi:MAG: hypothetical protein AAGC60_03810 [Acidobacteriota bacterium]
MTRFLLRAGIPATVRRLEHALSRPPVLALTLLSIVLLALPVATHKPGLPPTLKADEPAYYLAALSLAFDFDLRVDRHDLDRAFVEFPYLSVQNLIVMSDDGFNTLYYGKPYLFSLVAAPLAALFGADGMVLCNMALLVAMLWLGFLHLRRHASEAAAALFSSGFFVLGYGFVYVFWLHPEVFNMAAVAFCLYFGLPPGDRGETGAPATPSPHLGSYAFSAAALAAGTYNKPMLAAFALPVLVAALRRHRWRELATWVASAVAAMALYAGLSMLWTGEPTAYLVDHRAGFNLIDPSEPLVEPMDLPAAVPQAADDADEGESDTDAAGDPLAERGSAGWWWLLRVPDTTVGELVEAGTSFFVGRHTGLFVYLPFALLALIYFVLHGRRDLLAWAILVATFAVGLFFLVFIPFNWHGGGGFVGNRYFVMATPGLLFLVTRLRPMWPMLPAFAVAGLLVGPLVASPYGVVVPAPTLQVHARNPPFGLLPLELALREIPGYEGAVQNGLWLWGRRDMVRAENEQMWLRGGRPAVVWLMTDRPLERPRFWIRSSASPNRARFCVEGLCRSLELGIEPVELELAPPRPTRIRRARAPDEWERFYDLYVYRLEVDIVRAEIPRWHGGAGPTFPVGVEIRHLGEAAELEATPGRDADAGVSQ